MDNKDKKIPEEIIKKSEARYAAIKAIYANEINQPKRKADLLVLDIISLYHEETDELAGRAIDKKFLNKLVVGVDENIDKIDDVIKEYIGSNWSIERLGPVLLSILRVAIFELMTQMNTPYKVIINEYLNIANAYFDEKEAGFVNGVLDKIAHKVRQNIVS